MRTSNPTLREDTFDQYHYLTGEPGVARMTVQGSAQKALFLILLATGSGACTWTAVAKLGPGAALPWLIGGGLIAFILALVISFKQNTAPYLAPVYALVKGTALGAISAFLNARFPGIALQAVGMTFGIAIAMLAAYQFRVIRATPMFTKGLIAATGGVFLLYVMSFVLGIFGVPMPFLHQSTPLGIGINAVILVIASLNLVLDFDLIEQGAESGAPKYMEWYAGFGLVVTLFWIYIESLRLLSKLRDR